MTILEAIEELRNRRDHWAAINDRDGVESSQLGIEALKLVQFGRYNNMVLTANPLPGETKE